MSRGSRKRRHEVIMSDVIFSEDILDDLQLTEECLAALVLLQLSHSAISKKHFFIRTPISYLFNKLFTAFNKRQTDCGLFAIYFFE